MLAASGADSLFGFIIIAVGLAIYFLPSIVAHKKRNESAIVVLNLLLGWTILGWVVALVWALNNDPPAPPVVQLAPPILCGNCGKYSVPGSQFCSSCGGRFIFN